MKLKLTVWSLVSIGFFHATAQNKQSSYKRVDAKDWVLEKTDTLDYEQADYQGKSSFILKRNFGDPKRGVDIAYPKNLDFRNGTIELDIAAPDGKNGFVGVGFRIQDKDHYETLYFRPGSSGTINAVQYMPKKKLEFNWWDYEAEKYQSLAILPETGWFHVKLVVKDNLLTVYVNKGPKPVMQRTDLDQEIKTGSVGFWLGNCSRGAYRNLVVTKLD